MVLTYSTIQAFSPLFHSLSFPPYFGPTALGLELEWYPRSRPWRFGEGCGVEGGLCVLGKQGFERCDCLIPGASHLLSQRSSVVLWDRHGPALTPSLMARLWVTTSQLDE